MSDESKPLPMTAIQQPWHIVLIVLAIGGLAISGYLAFTALILGTPPAGCGGEAGCGAVLSSVWSKWSGMPVSLPATGLYVLLLVALLKVNTSNAGVRRKTWLVLLAGAVAVIVAACWFMYLQLFVIGHICVYCTIDHGIGLIMGIILLIHGLPQGQHRNALGQTMQCETGLKFQGKITSVIVGAVAAAVLILGQVFGPAPAAARGNIATDGDKDIQQTSNATRAFKLFDGHLDISIPQAPHHGEADATNVLVFMFDYCCPHCQKAHAFLPALREKLNGDLLTVYVATPLGKSCNKYTKRIPEFFERGCELAKLSMAVWVADPTKWKTYDNWLFEFPAKEPPSVEAARAKAVELVGDAALTEALAKPEIETMINNNIEAYGKAHGGRLPVILSPGKQPIIGAVYSVDDLIDMLETPSP